MGLPKLTDNQASKIIYLIIILAKLRLTNCIIYKYILKKKNPWDCPLSSNGLKNSTLITLSLINTTLLLRE
jgi:hypothetical protein